MALRKPLLAAAALLAAALAEPTLPATLPATEVLAKHGVAGQGQAIPVYVMLALDLVTDNGTVRDPRGLREQLLILKQTGVAGVMLDVWWGLVETAPMNYRWSPYLEIASLVQQLDLRMQVIMSFHNCGGNIGDECNIQLPSWLGGPEHWGYVDRQGQVNREYISLFYDTKLFGAGNSSRTPLQMYEDYMISFSNVFQNYLASKNGEQPTISTVEVGLGPCGEMRYPSYPLDRWNFPGIGEFQCYDLQARKALLAAATAAGRPDWGLPPDNAGHYSALPKEAPFFVSNGERSFDSDYGRFFLAWYAKALIEHGRAVLARAKKAFAGIPGVHLDAKIAGIHWQYADPSHAAELTAGYYNLGSQSGHDGYLDISAMLSEFDAGFCFTCLEMLNSEQTMPGSNSRPEELVLQSKQAAAAVGISYAGENALARFDWQAYETIIRNARMVAGSRSFTYLRIGRDLLEQQNLAEFARFVQLMAAPQGAKAAPEAKIRANATATPVEQSPPPRRVSAIAAERPAVLV